MKELSLPLLTHTGDENSFTGEIDQSLCDPLKLSLPLKLGVTVIAAHIATTGKSDGEDNFNRILPMFKSFPNLYADISSLTQINKLGYLEKALKEDSLKGRLLYGTDWPLQFFPLISPFYFPNKLSLSRMIRLSRTQNPWDRDVLLKKALGVTEETFSLPKKLILQES